MFIIKYPNELPEIYQRSYKQDFLDICNEIYHGKYYLQITKRNLVITSEHDGKENFGGLLGIIMLAYYNKGIYKPVPTATRNKIIDQMKLFHYESINNLCLSNELYLPG